MSRPDWWWDATWNVIGGCTPVSPGCENCLAATLAGGQQASHDIALYLNTTKRVRGRYRFNSHVNVLARGHPGWTWPGRWPGARQPKLGAGQPSLIFVCDMSDLFHKEVPTRIIDRTVATVAISDHIGLLVTKRVERMAQLFMSPRREHWRTKVLLGFSAERQPEFDTRWAVMRPLAERGWTVFVSLAPLIGPVTLPDDFLRLARWVIVNGEEKTAHQFIRRMDGRWARALRDQCAAAHIPFFMKGMGAQRHTPPDLLIRQFPPDWMTMHGHTDFWGCVDYNAGFRSGLLRAACGQTA